MNWKDDLKKSHSAFMKIILPEIREYIEGGRIISIEIIQDSYLANDLDRECGIDAWQKIEGKGCRGIASRVQFGEIDYKTFTIRKSRDSGTMTEYQKRKLAIETGKYIYPYWTCHGYIHNDKLLSAGVCRTIDLFNAIEDGYYSIKRTSNATFYVVEYKEIQNVKIF